MTENIDWTEVESRINQYFTDRVRTHGMTVRALDWGSEASQVKRFEIISKFIEDTSFSLLDVGCGFGQLADYLQMEGRSVEYVGVDLTTETIALARKRRPDLDFRVGSIINNRKIGKYDYVVASGIFYKLGSDAYPLMGKLINSMFAIVRKKLIFNSLSSWAADSIGDEFRSDPVMILQLCTKLSKNIALRHDYLTNDYTIAIGR